MSRHLESTPPGSSLGTRFDGLAPARQRDLNRQRVAKRRTAEVVDAFHFLTKGHDAHAETCLFGLEGGEGCARKYDPMPYAEAAPTPEQDYVGTGIGLLYGLGGECHAWQLAGWNVA